MANDNKTTNILFSRDHLKGNLKNKSMRNAVSIFSSNVSATTITLFSTVIMARLLSPKEFGLLAMVTAFTEFALIFKEIGLGSVTVQRKQTTHEQVSTLFWINSCFGFLIMIVFIAIAPILAWFYRDARILSLCIASSSIFFFGSLAVQHRSLLERQMKFSRLGILNVASTFLSVTIAILAAYKGAGVWSLVFRDISRSVFYTIGVWLFCKWIPGPPRRNTGLRSSLKFGMEFSGSEVIQYLTRSLDRVLLGRFYGAAVLGLYTKALQLSIMPIAQLSFIIWNVGFSPLSTLQSDWVKFLNYFNKMFSVMVFVFFPMIAFFAMNSEDIVKILLGNAWLQATDLFRIFTIAWLTQPIMMAIRLVMISTGKTRRCFIWGVVNSAFMIIAFSIGIFWGSSGLAYSYSIVSYAMLIVSLKICLKNTPVHSSSILKILTLPLFASICASGFLFLITLFISHKNVFFRMSVNVSLFSIFYLFIWGIIPSGRRQLKEYWNNIHELLKSKISDSSEVSSYPITIFEQSKSVSSNYQ